jgi:Ras-related C3 botulinum toxin substrate 1
MLYSYTQNKFPQEYIPTVFDNYSTNVMVDGKPVSLMLWDTAGQDDYDRLRPMTYPETDAFILCYSVVSQSSADNVMNKWVPELRFHCPDTPIILVGTKLDMINDDRVEADMKAKNPNFKFISKLEGDAIAKQIGAAGHIQCSSLTQENLQSMFQATIRAALKPVPVARKWYQCF